MSEQLLRRRVRIRGLVQGVGFRYFAMTAAQRCGTMGWVRNEPDGSVLCEAQGVRDDLDRFVTELQRGPRYGRVDEVAVDELELVQDPAMGFEIR